MNARLAHRRAIGDATRIGVELFRLDNRGLKIHGGKRQIQLTRAGLYANTPAIWRLVQHHATGVIPQTSQLLIQCC